MNNCGQGAGCEITVSKKTATAGELHKGGP